MRKIINWNEDWYFSKGEKVQPDFSETWMPVTLPHTWNAEDGQDGGNDYWRGTACYAKAFKKPELPEGNRVLLEVQGAAMTAEVFLNGEKLAHHEGGYSTFRGKKISLLLRWITAKTIMSIRRKQTLHFMAAFTVT